MIDMNLNKMIKEFEKKEKEQTEVLEQKRALVRDCSNAIKEIHRRKLEPAKKLITNVEEGLKKLKKYEKDFAVHLEHIEQEYTEAIVLLEIVETKNCSPPTKLKVSDISYLNGLMDVIGELRREMLDLLRKDNYKEAERMFDAMEKIFESVEPVQFSNSIVPGFRRKQDVARRQIEQARSEILYSKR
ncbi:hypothetical protein KO317_04275 [Candidatus Micrarchaeota archaeon]|nr:hypothetical protein [Candidatus Micrarchaeota archaeon]